MEKSGKDSAQVKCHSFETNLGPLRISINPVVTILSALIIWIFVIFCMVEPGATLETMTSTKKWISSTSTWFYIGTKNIWTLFIAFIFISKYGKIKLGKDDDTPEFSDLTYFTMLFAAGMGIGLFYYGVAEPVLHYERNASYINRYWGRYSDNQKSQDAMNITLFHWGIHAWIVYVIVALLLALVSHRHGRPMTIRSCFYPLIGNHVYSLIGDLIDTLSVVATMFGVCTSLGLGVITLSSGLHRLSSSIDESNNTTHVVIIWVITAIATVSVVSGLKIGIRRLSETCFALGMFLMLFVFFHGNTWYYLNVYVQSIGYYFQHVIETSCHTEAFAQEGNAPDGKENSKWMESWTIFYWGWWISWSPYVGMFIAKISRGRTIRNFLMYTMTAPVFYSFLWFSIFGAAGLTMEREAEIAGVNCSWLHGGKESEESYQGMYRLSCRASSQMFFDLMQSFNDRLTPFLYVISIISITLYFVTSSDSGSLVIDCLSANGSPDPPVLQRVFWALTEGACATGLLVAGGSDALTALQAVSIAAGLPYTVVICFMCVSLWKALKHDDKRSHKNEVEFNSGLFRLFTSPFNVSKLVDLFIALTFPWLPAGRAASKTRDKYMHMPMTVMAIMFYTVLALLILQIVEKDIVYIACVVLMGYFAYVASQRVEIRQVCGIDGNVLEDFLVVMFLHPFAVDQMNKQMVLKHALNGENEGVRLDEFKRNLEEIQENETVSEHASNG